MQRWTQDQNDQSNFHHQRKCAVWAPNSASYHQRAALHRMHKRYLKFWFRPQPWKWILAKSTWFRSQPWWKLWWGGSSDRLNNTLLRLFRCRLIFKDFQWWDFERLLQLLEGHFLGLGPMLEAASGSRHIFQVWHIWTDKQTHRHTDTASGYLHIFQVNLSCYCDCDCASSSSLIPISCLSWTPSSPVALSVWSSSSSSSSSSLSSQMSNSMLLISGCVGLKPTT